MWNYRLLILRLSLHILKIPAVTRHSASARVCQNCNPLSCAVPRFCPLVFVVYFSWCRQIIVLLVDVIACATTAVKKTVCRSFSVSVPTAMIPVC